MVAHGITWSVIVKYGMPEGFSVRDFDEQHQWENRVALGKSCRGGAWKESGRVLQSVVKYGTDSLWETIVMRAHAGEWKNLAECCGVL